jgi:viroplasmin and RNaseH domain-containing protein
MSIGINKDGMEEAGYAIQYNREIEEKFKIIAEQFENMNSHSRKIINFEGELSTEGIQETGRMQGRLDMLKLIYEAFGVDITSRV